MASDARIAALVTIATPVFLPKVTRSTFVRESLALLLPRNAFLLRHQSFRKMWAEWSSMGGAWFGEGLNAMIEHFDMLNTIRQIGPRPTLFVHGKRDFGVPPKNAQMLYRRSATRARTHLGIAGHARQRRVARQGNSADGRLAGRETGWTE